MHNLDKKYCELSDGLCPNEICKIVPKKTVFTAYSSHSKESCDEILNATKFLNKETDYLWETWEEDLSIENQLVFCEICKHICQSKAVMTDLTDLNFNVIFEYAYSFTLGVKTYPICGQDFNFSHLERYFSQFLGVGLAQYAPTKLGKKILKKDFWNKEIQNTTYSFKPKDILTEDLNIDFCNILYLKNNDSSKISDVIEKEIDKYNINTIIDDPEEDSYNINWYSKNIKKSFLVIIDLGAADPKNLLKHYTKCALVAGMSVASGRRVLIMASNSGRTPSDLLSLVKTYSKEKEVKRLVDKFLDKHINDISIIRSYISTLVGTENKFATLDLGEHVAENDIEFLTKCYVSNQSFTRMQRNGYKLIIGRKGTGKSASYSKLKMININSKELLVINERFDKYDLDEVYNLALKFKCEEEQDKVVLAYWQFILVAIISEKINVYIKDFGSYKKEDIDIQNDFTEAIQKIGLFSDGLSIHEFASHTINKLLLDFDDDIKKIQDLFYYDYVVSIKNKIVNFLKKMNLNIVAMFDGLDSNLSLNKNSEIITLVLYNLHEASSRVFSKGFNDSSVNLFVRTDLFDRLKRKITEKDKLNKIYLRWSVEDLIKIINFRLKENGINHISDLLDETFSIKKLMDKLSKYVYTRPRDYIAFFNSMIQIASVRGISKIDQQVFSSALEDYAFHVSESLEAEFMSLPKKIEFASFINKLKELNNDSSKISLQKLFDIFVEVKIEEMQFRSVISFLLETEFMFYLENSRKVVWVNILHPEVKLKTLIENSSEKVFFQLHPTVQFLLDKLI